MAKILEEALSFDDVLLVPRYSTIYSRFGGEIDLSCEVLPRVKIQYPIISANMDSVSGAVLVEKIQGLGGLGIMHRFMDLDRHSKALANLAGTKIACTGVGDEGFERIRGIVEVLSRQNIRLDGILIDIAHGHSMAMLKQVEKVVKFFNIPVMAGNVATYDGCLALLKAGASSVKVGVGPGSVCSTRTNTGNGVPQLTAVMSCKEALDDFITLHNPNYRPTLIGDGGIKNSGDIVKCIAGGADAVMVGGLFAATEEAPGNILRNPSGLTKIYRGMASNAAQQDWKGYSSSIEGESISLPYKGSMEPIFKELLGGILSGFSYQNARNIREMQENAVFVRQTSSGYRESLPHALIRQ